MAHYKSNPEDSRYSKQLKKEISILYELGLEDFEVAYLVSRKLKKNNLEKLEF